MSVSTGAEPTIAPEQTTTVVAMPFAKALNAGLRAAMAADDHVLLMGEDIGKLGGVFRITEGLQAEFGDRRVLDTPLAESGIVGTAIGLAMAGFRPVVEIQFDGFVFPAFDQITTQLAKLTNRLEGAASFPVVIRIPYGGHIGAIEHHQESPEAYFAHTAGLRVVTASTPQEAYSTLRAAIASDDPVLFFEPKGKYYTKGEVDRGVVRDLDTANVVAAGRDVTVAAYGPTVETALRAAIAAADEGIEIEVIDLRSISPLDVDTVVDSVRRTGRLVVAHEAPGEVSVSSELITSVVERAFSSLEAAHERVTGYDTPYPPSAIEHDYLPSLDRILDAVDRTLGRRSSRDELDAAASLAPAGAAR